MNNQTQLFESALSSRQNAYAPYSNFCVGASLITPEGKIFSSCNVENVSYPCGTCAEAGAISAMISAGYTQISELLVVADSKELITPCGACLQRIKEFSTPNTIIHLANLSGIQKSILLSQLLPHPFNKQELL